MPRTVALVVASIALSVVLSLVVTAVIRLSPRFGVDDLPVEEGVAP